MPKNGQGALASDEIVPYDSDIDSLSSISDDSVLNSDEDTSLHIKPSANMKERLEIRRRIQDKRKRNDIRKERRHKRTLDIARRKKEKELQRQEEERLRLENQIPLDEQVVILEKRVKRLERNLEIETKMATGSRHLVTKLTQKNSLLEREAQVLRHLAHQRQVDMLNERQARAKESIYIHKCSYAERELVSVKAQAKKLDDEVKRMKAMLLRKDHEIQVLNVGVKSTEQLIRVSEDDAQRKDSCLLDLEKVVEKLASDLSVARREALEWEIEHKRVEHELLKVQAVLARLVVGNPLATASDRAMVVTHARKRKPARILKVRSLVDSGQNYRPNSNALIVARHDARKEAELQQRDLSTSKASNSKSVNDLLESFDKRNNSGQKNRRYMSINKIIKNTSKFHSDRRHTLRVEQEHQVLNSELHSSIVLDDSRKEEEVNSIERVNSFAKQVENEPAPFVLKSQTHEGSQSPVNASKKSKSNRLRPQSAGPMYLAAFGQTGTNKTWNKSEQMISLKTTTPEEGSRGLPLKRPVSANTTVPEKYIPIAQQQRQNSETHKDTHRPVSATLSNAPSSIGRPENFEPAVYNYDSSRPTSANTYKSFSTSSGNSRPQSAVTDKSSNITAQKRPVSAISDNVTLEASDKGYDNLDDVFDSSSKVLGQAPPIHGELSTSGSVLGPLPDILSRKEVTNRQKRPTSAGLRVAGTKSGKTKNLRGGRPVSAQARTPIRQHRQATKYSSSRFYIDKTYDDHSINSARSSSTNGEHSIPTSDSFHIYDDKSDIASSVGTRSNSEYTNHETDRGSDGLSPITNASTKSHISNDNFTNTSGSGIIPREKDTQSLLDDGDTRASAYFYEKINSGVGTFQFDEDFLKQNSSLLSSKRQIYGKENNFENVSRTYSERINAIVTKGNKKKKKKKRKKQGAKNRIPGSRSKYYGRGLGFRRDESAVPTVFGGGSAKQLLNKIVKRLDPLSLEAAKQNEAQMRKRKGKAFVGKQKKQARDMVF